MIVAGRPKTVSIGVVGSTRTSEPRIRRRRSAEPSLRRCVCRESWTTFSYASPTPDRQRTYPRRRPYYLAWWPHEAEAALFGQSLTST